MSLLNVKLESNVIASDSGVGTATAAKSTIACRITFTVIGHLRDQEEVVTIEVNLQAREAQLLDPALCPCVGNFHILQAEIRTVVEILRTVVVGNLRGDNKSSDIKEAIASFSFSDSVWANKSNK